MPKHPKPSKKETLPGEGFYRPFASLAELKPDRKLRPSEIKMLEAERKRAEKTGRDKKPEGKEAAPRSDASAGDQDFFLSAMGGVTPIDAPEIKAREPGGEAKILSEIDQVLGELDQIVDGRLPFDMVDSDEYVEASVRGLNRRILKKLRSGDFALQANLDLHGLRSDEAREAVDAFIRRSRTQGHRCVLIVHGRGLGSKDHIPVLKQKLHAWLTRRSLSQMVLAYTSAKPYDGGTGAVYVLLRR